MYLKQYFAPNTRRNLNTHGYFTMTVPTSNQYNQVTNDEPMQSLATNSPQPQHAPHRSSAPNYPTRHIGTTLHKSSLSSAPRCTTKQQRDNTRAKKKNLQTTANPKPCLLPANITSDGASKHLVHCYTTENTCSCAQNITNNYLPCPHEKSSYFLQFLSFPLAFSFLSSN